MSLPSLIGFNTCFAKLTNIMRHTLKVLIATSFVFSLAACGDSSDGGETIVDGDNTPPVITLNGDAELSIEFGVTYIELGATANDNTDGNIEVSITGEVNTSEIGTYTITYTASDVAGNTAVATRTVTVVDTTAPSITSDAMATATIRKSSSAGQVVYTATSDDMTATYSLSSDESSAFTINSATGEVALVTTLDFDSQSIFTFTIVAIDDSNNESSIAVTLTIKTLSADAALSMLTINGAELDQSFQSEQYSYTANVHFLTSSITMAPIAMDDGATIMIGSNTFASGETSDVIVLTEGDNIITLTVTSEDTENTEVYTVEIQRAAAASFAQQAYLKASNPEDDDNFGYSVAISGDTLVVGANQENSSITENDNLAENAGAAYVFIQNDDIWTQQAYLKASNAEADDRFGVSVAIDGDTIVVGARKEDSSANLGEMDNTEVDSGAAYIFTRTDSDWTQQAFLKASNAEAGDYFGYSVALSGDTVVVASRSEDGNASGEEQDNTEENSGSVYVYTRTGNTWSQQAYLKASNPEDRDYFGWSVAISGNTLVIGAPYEDSSAYGGEEDNTELDSGAVYVFIRNGGSWSQQAYLKASNAEVEDKFGYSVAVDKDTIVVGAYHEDSSVGGGEFDNSESNAGAVYVFFRKDNSWQQQAYIKADNSSATNYFGWSVAISGETIVVGSNYEDESVFNSGAAYIFTRTASNWTQLSYLKASNAGSDDRFGSSIALDGVTAVIASPLEDSNASGDENNNTTEDSGAIYIWK